MVHVMKALRLGLVTSVIGAMLLTSCQSRSARLATSGRVQQRR